MCKKGSLTFVGTGILLGGHITKRAMNAIQKADVVFVSVADGITEKWIESLNGDVRSLQPYYGVEKARTETYKQMVEAILDEVRAGRDVVGALYGHPGVFALASHKSLEIAKKEGFSATMEPGISAEDCLFADLGVDPGKFGCQQYEATQFMAFERKIDTSAYLILWQIGVAGDLTYKSRAPNKAHLELLVDLLSDNYPTDHQVIVYEARTLPINNTRIEKISIKELPDTNLHDYSTLVIPPSTEMKRNQKVLDLISNL